MFYEVYPWHEKLGNSFADEFVERNHRMISFDVAKPRDILNLQNWVKGNACLAREETAYLTNGPDLMSMASSDDLALTRLEAWVEDFLIRFHPRFRDVRTSATGLLIKSC